MKFIEYCKGKEKILSSSVVAIISLIVVYYAGEIVGESIGELIYNLTH